MSTAKAIQIILARQLASCVAMPILLVDDEGTLIFYNEPAEAILNQRFEETGEIPADEWNRLVTVADEDRNPVAPEDRPNMTSSVSGITHKVVNRHLSQLLARGVPKPNASREAVPLHSDLRGIE
ncbi:MAG TPA: hypothetical protein VGR42_15980 [Casimicrobiaceae bacterium]|jgi:PAS domain-containing protein|nr:hypothetical protein [Casimicrobiaceae bacterium]